MKRRSSRLLSIITLSALALTACGGGGGSNSSMPPAPNNPAPGPSPASSADCPTSGSAPASFTGMSTAEEQRRGPATSIGSALYVPGEIVVDYDSAASSGQIDRAIAAVSVHSATEVHFDAVGMRSRVLSLDPSRVDRTIAQLKTAPGVLSVHRAQYRQLMSVNVNDPYYQGFGPGAPYFESAASPGEWDLHAIDVGSAWGEFSSVPVAGAPIAILDTGVDVTHPDMAGGKIIRTECFVTFPLSSSQSTSTFVTDTSGHGTNVAGIADADTNNSFGFAGVGFNAPLLAYRIFPTTPSGGCENSKNPQCNSTDVDEVSAINDAIAHGAKVINLSLGAPGPLSSCQDPTEENAIESAIHKGVVVVAAAGNDGKAALDCPAAYPGVIAVGADGISDSGTIKEVVASYSNYSTAGLQSGGGAYLVAPGGTASGSADSDDLHWIENITSSQQSGASGFCSVDAAGASNDCRGLFAGTSQATPHITGVVSLMLAINPSLTPAEIASDLCSTAQSIGDSKQGCGRVDAGAAVTLAKSQ